MMACKWTVENLTFILFLDLPTPHHISNFSACWNSLKVKELQHLPAPSALYGEWVQHVWHAWEHLRNPDCLKRLLKPVSLVVFSLQEQDPLGGLVNVTPFVPKKALSILPLAIGCHIGSCSALMMNISTNINSSHVSGYSKVFHLVSPSLGYPDTCGKLLPEIVPPGWCTGFSSTNST